MGRSRIGVFCVAFIGTSACLAAAAAPASQPPATHAQSEQLQQFLQWREKEDPAETSH
jgi:hypothetical protein